MVELLVAMMLLSIVMVGVSRVLVAGWGGVGKTTTEQAASGRMLNAVDRMRSDIVQAYNYRRSQTKIRDSYQLRLGILNDRGLGLVQSQDPADTSQATVDIRDILVAQPDDLVLRADVVASPVGSPPWAECVEYRVLPAGSGWKVTRSVWADSTGLNATACTSGGGGAGTPIFASVEPLTEPVFTYYTVWCGTPGSCATSGCAEAKQASVSQQQVGRITSVGVKLKLISANGKVNASRAASNTRISIRSRESGMYRGALGCA